MDLQSIFGDGGVAGVFLYLIFRDLIKPKFTKFKYSKPENDRRKPSNPNSKNSKPGQTTICRENRDKLLKLEQKVDDHIEKDKEDHKDIKDNFKKLFNLWDNLKTRPGGP